MAIGITRAETQINNESSTGAEGYFIQSDGSVAMDADLRMDDNKIVQLEDPTDPQDAVNLRTLEDEIAAIVFPPTERNLEFFDPSGPGDDTFTVSEVPVSGSERVALNGVGPLRPGAGNDYTISGDTVTMLCPVRAGDAVSIDYVPV